MDHPNTDPNLTSEPKSISREIKNFQNKPQAFFIGFVVVILLLILGVIAFVIINSNANLRQNVSNFEECEVAGNLVVETYPRRCTSKDGRVFTEQVDGVVEVNPNPVSNPQSNLKNINIYYSVDPESFENPSFTNFVRRETDQENLIVFALSELIKGPSTTEMEEDNLFSEIVLSGESNCNGNNFEYELNSSELTVQFCKDLISSGVLADARIKSIIIKTLEELEEVDNVNLLDKNGEALFDSRGN